MHFLLLLLALGCRKDASPSTEPTPSTVECPPFDADPAATECGDACIVCDIPFGGDLSALEGCQVLVGDLVVDQRTDLRTLGSAVRIDGTLSVGANRSVGGLHGLRQVDALVVTAPLGTQGLEGLSIVDGPVALSGGADLGSLEALAKVGELSIVDAEVDDLWALACLTEVQGTLTVHNSSLTELGLAATEVGGLSLVDLPELTSAADVAVVGVVPVVELRNLPKLVDVSLERVERIQGYLLVDGLPSLAGVDLSSLEEVTGSLTLRDASMAVLELGALEHVGGYATLEALSGLVAVSAPRWTEVERNLVLRGNPDLTSLDGMGALKRLKGDLVIDDNDALVTLAPWPLVYIVGDLVATDNASLVAIGDWPNLDHISYRVEIHDNPALERIDGMPSLVRLQSIEVTGSPSLTSIDGFARVDDPDWVILVGTGLTDLSALSGVRSPQTLTFEDNPRLSSLRGLENLVDTWNLTVKGSAITDLEGLGALTELRIFTLEGNPELEDLDGLGPVEISIRVDLLHNPALTSVDALSGCCDELQSLDVEGNDVLTSLAPLALPDAMGGIDIVSNPSLSTLDGLLGVQSTYHLAVTGNTSLCASEVDAWVSTVEVTGKADGELLIAHNDDGC